MKRSWSPETGFFIGLLLFLLLVGRSSLFRDPGTFWHVVVGDRILSTGFFDTDPFSFTRAGETWIPNQWLAECSMALLYRASEFDALLLYTAAVLAAAYALVGGRFVRAGFHWLPTTMLVGLVIGASSHHFHARPHVLTITLMAWTFAKLLDVDADRAPLRSLWRLVPVFLIWTNWHGGMLGGLATLIITSVGWIVADKMARSRGDTVTHPVTFSPRHLVPIIAACALAMIVTPYGIRLPGAWWAIMSADLPTMIIEHRPLELLSSSGLCFLLLSLLYLAGLAGAWPKVRVTWLVPLFWLWQGWSRSRHTPLFAVTAALALADILPNTRWIARLGAGSDLFRTPSAAPTPTIHRPWAAWIIPAAMVLLIFALETVGIPLPLLGRGWAKLDPALWPNDPALIADLREAAQRPETRLFNEYAFGGFVMLFAPGLPVFIDDRCELYPELLPAYVAALRADSATRGKQMEAWTRQYGLNLALTHSPTAALNDPGRPFDDYLRSPEAQALGWRVARQTAAATLFQRLPASGEPTSRK